MNRTGIAATLVALVATAACSGGDGSATPTTESPSASQEVGGVISPKLPKIPKFHGKPEGVIADVEVADCDTEAGAVSATGTATNSAKRARDLVVVMSWAVSTTGDVRARAVSVLPHVPAGDSVDWTAKADLAEGEPVACVATAWSGRLR